MKKILSILILTSILFGCYTSTKITAYWGEKEYKKGDIHKILVLGITKREAVRRLFEHDMCTRLKEIGIEGIPSSDVFPPDQKLDTNTFRLHFSSEGFDAIITSKLVSADKQQHYQSGYGGGYAPYNAYGGFYGYYGSSYDMMYSPGYSFTTTTLKIETNLYDVKTEKLVWAGISDTFDPSDESDAISSLNRKLVDVLTEQGYFVPKE